VVASRSGGLARPHVAARASSVSIAADGYDIEDDSAWSRSTRCLRRTFPLARHRCLQLTSAFARFVEHRGGPVCRECICLPTAGVGSSPAAHLAGRPRTVALRVSELRCGRGTCHRGSNHVALSARRMPPAPRSPLTSPPTIRHSAVHLARTGRSLPPAAAHSPRCAPQRRPPPVSLKCQAVGASTLTFELARRPAGHSRIHTSTTGPPVKTRPVGWRPWPPGAADDHKTRGRAVTPPGPACPNKLIGEHRPWSAPDYSRHSTHPRQPRQTDTSASSCPRE